MKEHHLKALVQVAESASIRAAARAMNLSQSALTKALRELEESVGAELLNRSYRGIEFTTAGKVLLQSARLSLSILDKAEQEICLLRGGTGARVVVAVTPTVSALVLPRVLREYESVQPDAEITLTEGLFSRIVPDLIEGNIDFALALGNPAELPQEIIFEPLCQIESSVSGRVGHPLQHAQSWSELNNAKWALNICPGSMGSILVKWLEQQGLFAPGNIVHCSSTMLMLELIRRSDHLGFIPTLFLIDPFFKPDVCAIAVQPMPPAIPLGLLSLRGVPLSSAARRMATLFQRYLNDAP